MTMRALTVRSAIRARARRSGGTSSRKPAASVMKPGVINSGGIGAFFSCTNLDKVSVTIGVEIFGSAGGSPVNDAAGTSLSVLPGATVTFGSPAVGISIDSNYGVGGFLGKASARILATSKKIACTAYIADLGNAPPVVAWQLTIIAKTKQKAAN